jgi:DNA-directed RNA polymerase specialized sigma24 family protein
MLPETIDIARHLPSLRRYARSLTGSQERGDRSVRVSLETLLAEPTLLRGGAPIRLSLYRLYHDVWNRVPTGLPSASGADGEGRGRGLEAHMQHLPAPEREMLLLTTVEGFSLDEAAEILRISPDEAETLLRAAHADLNAQTATTVLIIEDEPVIALDLAGIVSQAGHHVVGTATTRDDAVRLARARRPGVVLADIQLGDGSSGIDAAADIQRSMDVPVIFVTAYPERLLTGAGGEPTYLVTKPFDPDILKVTISQALIAQTAPGKVRAAG